MWNAIIKHLPRPLTEHRLRAILRSELREMTDRAVRAGITTQVIPRIPDPRDAHVVPLHPRDRGR